MLHQDIHKTLNTWQRVALAIGIVAAVPCGFAAASHNEHFYHAYLVGFLLWMGVSGGSLLFLCIHHLVSGRWGFIIQRMLEAAARTIPLMALLFLPIAFGMGDLYKWMHPEGHLVAIVAAKSSFLNEKAFLFRSGFYFLVWTFMAFALSRWSRQLDATGDANLVDRMGKLAAPGIVVFVLTASCASVDWMMSLEPDWWSTMYGPLFIIGQALSAMCVMAIVAHRVSHYKPFSGKITHQHFHDIGNLMFACTILWAYMNIGQYIIIWSANMPEEDVFFLDRRGAGWPGVAIILAVFHFIIPFLLMLNKGVKRHSRFLAEVAGFIIIMRAVDYYWLVTPTFHKAASFHWLVFTAPIAVGGLWLAAFLQNFKRHALLPEGDPRFKTLIPIRAEGHG